MKFNLGQESEARFSQTKGKEIKKVISNDYNSLSQPCEHNCCWFQPFLGRSNGNKSVTSHLIINYDNHLLLNYDSII